ncbi:metal ABC transporter permease [Hippea maritima]|uniref:ABC-type transporter, integral membrane subunit n=1 Tax=Hippea maritima (strain ATCC 700847 / DSM 10411 / MH2) TaxID=760142 RepID=F2LW70_HIPMA|nr:metal ABC transporter permease [Hippea maritima]AEA34004.1 ABC-type transporter, integral membrane subunit [Hippea maritima DSM 10411]
MVEGLLFRAAIVGVLLAIPLSIMSYFVVMRKMTFAGVGIAHSAFGGVALNFLLGFSSFLFPVVFCLLASLFIGFMYRKGGFSEDSIIDVIFVFSMAFGVFILSLSEGYSANILGILFGDILSVGRGDVFAALGVFFVGVVFVSFFFSHLHLATYNEELAKIRGINTDFLYYAFWAVLSLTVVFSIKLIGIILVNAFLVLPTLVGLNLSRNYRGIIATAVISSIISIAGGVFVSYVFNAPTGATIVLVYVLLWLLSFFVKLLRS